MNNLLIICKEFRAEKHMAAKSRQQVKRDVEKKII